MKTKGSRNKKGVKRLMTIFGYYDVFNPTHPLAKKNGYIREHRMIAYDAGILTKESFNDERADKNIIEVIGNIYENQELLKESEDK